MKNTAEGMLLDVLDRVLDKGIVIDAHVRIGVVGVELLAVEARFVVASIETYLMHADAIAFTAPAARPAVPALEGEVVATPPPLFAEPVAEALPAAEIEAPGVDVPGDADGAGHGPALPRGGAQ